MNLIPGFIRTLVRSAAFLCIAACVFAQQHGTDPTEIDAGARLYAANCISCHGPGGDLISGVTLMQGKFRHASSDDELYLVIKNGVPGTAMPPHNMSIPDLTALVAYLHAMRDFRTKPVRLGDARNGRVLFEGKGECATCHRINGRGSHFALDLSDIGALRSAAWLEGALLDPKSADAPQNRMIRAVLRDGTTIQGRRLNEDTYTVQLMTDRQKLVSLVKADLETYRVITDAIMPSYKDRISDDERADLLAYLVSLQGVEAK
jgi:cytochrome c oxidase cbb3-type subunit III